jgi:hypothetical protein
VSQLLTEALEAKHLRRIGVGRTARYEVTQKGRNACGETLEDIL